MKERNESTGRPDPSADLLRYLSGSADERDRYLTERDMEADPFLKEAAEGLEQLDPQSLPGRLEEVEADLRRQLLRHRPRRKRRWRPEAPWMTALAVILLVALLMLAWYLVTR